MIRKAKFENFKGLRDVEITFESRFTVLVGPNGTGKTSVLQGVELADAFIDQPVAPTPGLQQFPTEDLSRPILIRLLDQHGDGIQVVHPLPKRPADFPGCSAKRMLNNGALMVSVGANTPNNAHNTDEPIRFGPILYPQFRSGDIAAASKTTAIPPIQEKSGYGTPSVLMHHFSKRDGVFEKIEYHLSHILPAIQLLRVEEAIGEDGADRKIVLFDTTLACRIPAHQMSDGTLYILALIVAVLGPHRPKTLLIDDIDQRLHPKAQYELVALLKKFLDEFPDLQIIATSHSPYILDRLDASEVLVTELADDGSVVVAPLTAHPTYSKWSESMTPGEFWSHTGEGWVKQLKREPATP